MHYIGQRRYVAVLKGAADVLVTHRELRGHTVTDPSAYKKRKKNSEAYYKSRTKDGYQTNRSIKTWSTYFLLKSISIPGIIKCWRMQKDYLLQYCKMTESCFMTRLKELKALKLITISKDLTIHLTSFENAAEILGIEYIGTVKIEYNAKAPGKQIFQYYLVLDEIRCNQEKQIEAISYKTNKNPLLRETLEAVMIQLGADGARLDDERYFQEYLFRIQLVLFKTGSDIWSVVCELRGDKNRSVNGIRKQYGYRSAQSVSYLKSRLLELDIAMIEKMQVESDVRTRLYVPDEQGRRRDGVKYCRKTKRTILFLCDAIIPKIRIIETKAKKKAQEKAA